MPNHITNILTITDGQEDERARLRDLLGANVDFCRIVPQPQCVRPLPPDNVGHPDDGPSCHIVSAAVMVSRQLMPGRYVGDERGTLYPQEYEAIRRGRPRDWQHFARCLACIAETGYAYWRDWQIAHWGTKWNAYNQFRDGDRWAFDTAWSTPMPIWEALAKQFPTLTLQVEYADEDIGHNCGTLTLSGGSVTGATPADPDAFAMRVRGRRAEGEAKP